MAKATAAIHETRLKQASARTAAATKRLNAMKFANEVPTWSAATLMTLEKAHPMVNGVRDIGLLQCHADEEANVQCTRMTNRGEYCTEHLDEHIGVRIAASTVCDGEGLFATRRFNKGDVIDWYYGDRMLRSALPMESRYATDAVEPGAPRAKAALWVIEGSRTNAGVVRLVNDPSGSPFSANTEMHFESISAINMYAMSRILPGQELLMNYGPQYWNGVDPTGAIRQSWLPAKPKTQQPTPSTEVDEHAARSQLIWLCRMMQEHVEDIDDETQEVARKATEVEASILVDSDVDEEIVDLTPDKPSAPLSREMQRKLDRRTRDKERRDLKKAADNLNKAAARVPALAAVGTTTTTVRKARFITTVPKESKTARQRILEQFVVTSRKMMQELDDAWLKGELALRPTTVVPKDVREARYAAETRAGVRRVQDKSEATQRAVYEGVNDVNRRDLDAEVPNPLFFSLPRDNEVLDHHIANKFDKNALLPETEHQKKGSIVIIDKDDAPSSGDEDDNDENYESDGGVVSLACSQPNAIASAETAVAAAATASVRITSTAVVVATAQLRVARARSRSLEPEMTNAERLRANSLQRDVTEAFDEHRKAVAALADFNTARKSAAKAALVNRALQLQTDCNAIVENANDEYVRDVKQLQRHIRQSQEALDVQTAVNGETFETALHNARGSCELITEARRELDVREAAAATSAEEIHILALRAETERQKKALVRNRDVVAAQSALNLARQKLAYDAYNAKQLEQYARDAQALHKSEQEVQRQAEVARLARLAVARDEEQLRTETARIASLEQQRYDEEAEYRASRQRLADALKVDADDATMQRALDVQDRADRLRQMKSTRERQAEMDEEYASTHRRRMVAGTGDKRRSHARSLTPEPTSSSQPIPTTERRADRPAAYIEEPSPTEEDERARNVQRLLDATASATAEYVSSSSGDMATTVERELREVPAKTRHLASIIVNLDPTAAKALAEEEEALAAQVIANAALVARGAELSQAAAVTLATAVAAPTMTETYTQLAATRLVTIQLQEEKEEEKKREEEAQQQRETTEAEVSRGDEVTAMQVDTEEAQEQTGELRAATQ